MMSLLLKIIPLDLAATLSPGLIALTVILLGTGFHSKLKVLALLLGNILTGLIIVALGFYVGTSLPQGVQQNSVEAVINILLGLFFIYFAFKTVCREEKIDLLSQEQSSTNFIKWLILGFLVSITNFDAVFLLFTATKEVGNEKLEIIAKVLLSTMNLLFFILPVSLPFILYLIFPNFAKNFLEKFNSFLVRYSKYIIFILFLIFAVYFIVRGLKFFV